MRREAKRCIIGGSRLRDRAIWQLATRNLGSSPSVGSLVSLPSDHANNWPDLLIGLYDNLTGRRAEITYEFDNMHIKIPSGTGPSAEHAEWVLHGTMKIRTRDTGTSPN
jgi:hypothetical protein